MAQDVLNLEKIREAVRQGNYRLTVHARIRKGQRKIREEEILEAIINGEIIEKNPKAKPLPKCLIMGFIRENKPLYVSCAFNTKIKMLYIITVHWMDPRKWVDPWTRRR